MLINSIYLASEGEGVFIGTPQIFVRFNGCDIRCENCDSSYSWNHIGTEKKELSWALQEIFKTGYDGRIKRVSITGGNPLASYNIESVIKLAKALKSDGYFVNVEAAGEQINHSLFDLLDFISIDFKTPSTGVNTDIKNILEMFKHYEGRFQVKSVIETKKDFDYVLTAYNLVRSEIGDLKAYWILTPSYNTNESFPQERFQNVLTWNEKAGGRFRVIGQQHKWIYGPKKTNC